MNATLGKRAGTDLVYQAFERIGANSEEHGYGNIGEFKPLGVGAAIFRDSILREYQTRNAFFMRVTRRETETILSYENLVSILAELGGVDTFEEGMQTAGYLRRVALFVLDGALISSRLDFNPIKMPNNRLAYKITDRVPETDWTDYIPEIF